MSTLLRSLRWLPLATFVLAAAQPAVDDIVITGTVTEGASGGPLEAAQVYIEGTGFGALTRADGSFRIEVPVGSAETVRLRVDLIGYRSEVRQLRLAGLGAGDTLRVDVHLTAQALTLDEIVLTTAGAAEPGRTGRVVRAPGTPVVAADASVGTGAAASVVVVGPRRHPAPWRGHREQYAAIRENGFRSVADHPLSTFSTDVDRASYSNVRRFLMREGRLPPVDAVQVEELVNYFSYDYAMPRGNDPVGITTEVGVAPWNRRHQLLRIGLATRPVLAEDMPPANLVFLIDVSGSMSSPNKLPLVKRSLRLLVDQLRPQDRVAIVVYAGAAGVVLEPTSGRHRSRILEALDRLEAGGSTAGGEGLRLAYRVARRHFDEEGNNRVILATDGDFNVGESSDAAMTRLVETHRDQGTYLTVLGFGSGNLQAAKMQQIAQNGNGNWAYIDGMTEARKVFLGELGGTLLTVAQDVKLQIEFNPEHVSAYRLIGYENRLLADEDFNDDTRDAGDLGAGHRVTALYELIPTGARSWTDVPRVDPLRYQSRPDVTDRAEDGELAFVRLRYKRPGTERSRLLERPVTLDEDVRSADFHFAAAVAGFGMILRDSEHRGTLTTHDVLELAHEGMGRDPEGYRRGFVELVHQYRRLSGEHGPR